MGEGVRTAPIDWYYHSFPLREAGQEAVSLEWTAALAEGIVDRAEASGDETPLGPVLHWAHLLKAEQGPEGDWPARVNARTGAAIGSERTRAPARLLERLGAFLASTEFEDAVRRAGEPERSEDAAPHP